MFVRFHKAHQSTWCFSEHCGNSPSPLQRYPIISDTRRFLAVATELKNFEGFRKQNSRSVLYSQGSKAIILVCRLLLELERDCISWIIMLYFIFHPQWSIFWKLQSILTLFSENDVKGDVWKRGCESECPRIAHSWLNRIVHFGSLEKPTTLIEIPKSINLTQFSSGRFGDWQISRDRCSWPGRDWMEQFAVLATSLSAREKQPAYQRQRHFSTIRRVLGDKPYLSKSRTSATNAS